jgi:hypothetical protein
MRSGGSTVAEVRLIASLQREHGGSMKDRWLRFKEGFVSIWRLLYVAEDKTDWYAQVGMIFGVVTMVGLWKLLADLFIGLVKWMVS